MVTRETLLNLNFYKKAAFTGSSGNFCYKIERKEEKLLASVWKGPYCSEAVPDEKKEYRSFEFSGDGLSQIAEWLNVYVKEHKEES